MNNKKAQTWYGDFMIAIALFAITMIIYYQYASSISVENKNAIKDLLLDAKAISSSLIEEGYPANWSTFDVNRIGITDGNYRLKQSKIDSFAALDYSRSKFLLGISSDYFVFFEDKYGNVPRLNETCGIGSPQVTIEVVNITGPWVVGNAKCLVNMSNTMAKNIAKVERIVLYNSSLLKMVVYSWN
ncbi:MAG: hypothetical protein Q7J54_00390 [Candidatus Woesearchaeota archaeon]|nr:hypothetical protein [Candidatus Woesearchaeota archaeon]